MTIIQLRPGGIATLFDDSVRASAPPPLASDIAGKAIRLHLAGADAAAIAEQLNVRVAQVIYLLERRAKAQEALERSRKARQAKEGLVGEVVPNAIAVHLVEADLVEASVVDPRPEPPEPTSPPSAAAVVVVAPAPEPDVELTALQQRALRYARTKFGMSIEMLARAARTNPDQIRRICGEVP
jgi:hypothetical protein